MATMVQPPMEPYVNHIPTMIGGKGRSFPLRFDWIQMLGRRVMACADPLPILVHSIGQKGLAEFYREHFVYTNPEVEMKKISRTIGHDQLVDEVRCRPRMSSHAAALHSRDVVVQLDISRVERHPLRAIYA
jgi:hypothetical protein